MKAYSRRSFLAGSAVTAATLALRPRLHAAGSAQPAVVPSIRLFDYGQIELSEGPMRQQFDQNHSFFLKLEEDRLLKPFREAAGQNAPGERMGDGMTLIRRLIRKPTLTASFLAIPLGSIFPDWRARMR